MAGQRTLSDDDVRAIAEKTAREIRTPTINVDAVAQAVVRRLSSAAPPIAVALDPSRPPRRDGDIVTLTFKIPGGEATLRINQRLRWVCDLQAEHENGGYSAGTAGSIELDNELVRRALAMVDYAAASRAIAA